MSRGAHERVGVEVRVPGGVQGRVRCCRPAGRRRRRRRSRSAPDPRCSAARAGSRTPACEQRWSSSRIPAWSSSWRITQSTTVSMSRPWTAAACSIGASSAWARLAQCERSVVPAPMFAVIARAISSAPSHERDGATGDQRSSWPPARRCRRRSGQTPTPARHRTVPAGRPPHVRLGRGRHRRAGVREQRRDDHRRWSCPTGAARAAAPPAQPARTATLAATVTPRYSPPQFRAAAARTAFNGSPNDLDAAGGRGAGRSSRRCTRLGSTATARPTSTATTTTIVAVLFPRNAPLHAADQSHQEDHLQQPASSRGRSAPGLVRWTPIRHNGHHLRLPGRITSPAAPRSAAAQTATPAPADTPGSPRGEPGSRRSRPAGAAARRPRRRSSPHRASTPDAPAREPPCR